MRVLSFVSNSSVPNLGHRGRRRKATPARKPPTYRLGIEALAERCLLSANVVQANLVSDMPGVAQVQDSNLVNPWGISESSSSPFWISDNNAGVSTLYSVPGTNNSPVSITPLVVSIPTPGDPLGASGTPTGTVFNIDGGATGGFTVSGVDKNGNPITAAANFLFDTEDGTLVGWNPAVNPQGFDPAKAGTYGIIAVDNSGNNFTQPDPAKQTGAVYTGMTTASSATPGMPIFATDPNTTTVLYAANFRSGQVEVYDTNFKPVALPAGAFADPKLPKGYAPFNVQVLGSKVYVTYAKQNANKHDDVGGQGNGFIDVFNLDGTPGLPGGKERLVSRGPLDSPWGLALAPPSFGAQSGDLLVGNFKSGLIDVFNPTTGKSLGNLKGAHRKPIHIDRLRALQVGNGGSGGDANSVYFTAGLDHKTHGLFGSLTPAAPAAVAAVAADPGGTDVLTYHNDTSRTGANLNETTLTPQNVNASDFGKLFSYDLDGQVYAQPLEVSNLKIDGKVHNVVFVATENDSVYALDADNPTVGPHHNGVLWHTSFINPAKGITPVPEQDVQNNGVGPTYGITATPVIDLATKTIYVVSQEKEQPNNAGGQHYVQEFSALNILTGKARTVAIGNTTLQPDGSFINKTKIAVAGTGSGSDDGVVKFNALRQLPRMGLVLDMDVPGHPNGVVFTGSASDGDIDPYHGWLIGYDAKTLKLVTFFNSTPNGDFGGIWQGGGAPDVLPNGDLLLGTGNGTFDNFTTTTAPGAAAQGEGGFGLGSSGLGQSAAIPFAISIPSSGVSSTGLFFNGDTTTDQPRAPDIYQPLAGTGIDFTAGAEDPNGPDTFQATLSYSGTTLTETITDLTTGASFSRDYTNVNLPATVGGSDTAFVGFGGGTDGRTSTDAITSWTYSSGGQTLIDHSAGFASNGDVTATGVTKFNGTAADVTTGDGQQAGNLFANSPVNIANFTTTFDFQIQPPSSPTTPVGDGLSFIIQNDPGHAAGPDFGESYLELKPTPGRLTVVDNFTPFDVKARDIIDADTASTAETLLPTFPGTAAPNEAVAADKSGRIYLLNTDNLGGFTAGGPDQVLQEFTANPQGLIYSSPVYFNGMVYIQGVGDVIKAFALELDPATNTMVLNETPVSEGTTIAGFPGEVQSVSADGTSNGIVWSAEVNQNATGGPAVLQAYAANNLSTPLYTSTQAGPRDTAGGAIKFSVPTIANGHVYLGALNELDAYGILPPPGSSTSPSLSGNAGVSVRTAVATVRTRDRRVLAAAKPAGPLATRIARAALPSSRRTPARAEGAGTNPS